MTNYVTAVELKAMLSDGGELALMDVREEGAHSQSHLFYTVPMPLSSLELLVGSLVPRFGTRMVLVDAGGGFAERAAAKLADMGYSDLACLEGGIAAWEAAGYVLFSGVHVPCKAFGEYVEHHYGTPHIAAEELQAMREGGGDLVILDSRPMDEYQVMNIPDGIDCPGAELACRVHDLAPDPTTTVVVNCAGRTRSIIGAQSLINAGIPNPVVALENGTMGWHLAGYQLERGQSRMAPRPSAAAQTKARHVPKPPASVSRCRLSTVRPLQVGRRSRNKEACISSMCAIRRNMPRAIPSAWRMRRAGNWCRALINGSAPWAPALFWLTTTACGPP